ncbi:sugar transferase [Leucobacter luti]|uniref:sugar transferase n=1 Tax=Leucobacter luti TaxID=340320 RepID=UPI003D030889
MSAPAWERRYGLKLALTDFIIVFVAVFGAQVLRFGIRTEDVDVALIASTEVVVTYSLVSLALALSWFITLGIGESRDPKVFGIGPVEYKRVVSLTLFTFGLYAIIAFSLRAQVGRGYLLIALPAGLLLLLLSRWLWRKRLHRQRARHRNIYRALVVGERTKSAHIAQQIARNRHAGFGLLGAVTELGSNAELLPGLPVVASYDDLLEAVDRLKVDTLIMTSPDSIAPERMRRIGWELEARNVDLIVTVALTDIAGPRIHTTPISGLPLIHVEHPKFSGRKQFAKRVFDLLGSAALIVLTAPIMLAVAIAVKVSSKGPVLYSQQRVGLSGGEFPMLKFRSMVQNADQQLAGLLQAQGTSDVPLHKVENDPRITPVGKIIRRYSLDELPQLFNVFVGSMSLVGPRPQRDAEVALYQDHHHRRLKVKPGITGLWQVSGRSDLTWEDAIRLDLYYVENWSMVGDLLILWRTVRAVVAPVGAV